MIELLTSDLVSGALGGVTGFVFRYMAERAKERSAEHVRALEALSAAEKSRDDADKRDVSGGTWTRRILMFAIVFSVVVALFIMPIIKIPVVVEVKETTSILFGLIEWASPRFEQVAGYLLLPEHRQAFLALIFFYFGQGIK